jgi:DNA replication protein DnaC
MSQEQPAPCGQCGGTGFVIVSREGASLARLCVCRERPAAAGATALLEAARVPRRYADCEFDNFDAFGEHALSLANAKAVALRYAEEYPLSDRGLLFMGPPGVGKTHVSVAILRRLLLDKGVPALFCDVQDLLRQLQATFDRQSGMTQLDLLQPVLSTELVLLDDLGGRQFSPWVEETLAHIVTTRYNERRATLVTTNYLDEPPDARTPTLSDRIGVRVRSRLHEMCHLVQVRAADFRSTVKRADHQQVPDRIGRPREHR